jgi:hypothetical protein
MLAKFYILNKRRQAETQEGEAEADIGHIDDSRVYDICARGYYRDNGD